MKRTLASIVATTVLTLCAAWTLPRLAAEPFTGSDVTASSATGSQPQEVTDAIARFKERDFDAALKSLKEATKKNADLPPAQLLMAQLFSQANISAGVVNSLEQAVVEFPNDPEAYVVMADMLLRERRVTAADLLYEKATLLMPKFDKSVKRKDILQPRIMGGLAAVAEAREDWPSAQKYLDAWLKLEPKNTLAMQYLARCLFHQKNAAGALEKLKDAAKLDAEITTPEAILAQYYEQAGDRENAKTWMAKAVAAAAKNLRTRLIAGQWALETGQIDEAKSQAAAALQIDSNSLDAKILYGVIELFQKNYEKAEAYSESALIQSPGNFAASNNLALALAEQKVEAKKQKALTYAQNNVQLHPKSAEAYSTYGWVLYKLGQLPEAEKALQTAVSGGQINADTAYYLACVLRDRGRAEQARQWLENALSTKGSFSMRQEARALLEQLKDQPKR